MREAMASGGQAAIEALFMIALVLLILALFIIPLSMESQGIIKTRRYLYSKSLCEGLNRAITESLITGSSKELDLEPSYMDVNYTVFLNASSRWIYVTADNTVGCSLTTPLVRNSTGSTAFNITSLKNVTITRKNPYIEVT